MNLFHEHMNSAINVCLLDPPVLCRRITEAQLNGLLSIEEIRGSLIVFNYGDVQLPYLRNVKVIGSHNITLVNAREEFGDQRASENVAIYIRGNQRLSSIDLSSLQQVVSGRLKSVG